MSNDWILLRIQEEFSKKHRASKMVKLPSHIDFVPYGTNGVEMIIKSEMVGKPMQDDKANFEGWALVMKRWGEFEKVILRWGRPNFSPNDPANGSYQRFLFRAHCFSNHFSDWFSIHPDSRLFLKSDLRIKPNITYFLNEPSKNRPEHKPQRDEGKLEKRFVNGDLNAELLKITESLRLDRQLKVGLFNETKEAKKVSKSNAIFPHRPSAVDIWGISKNNELLLLELKKGKGSVGIISELYFYSCVMQCVREGQFQFKEFKTLNLNRIAGASKIKAYFLAPKLHRLIDDEKIFDDLNAGTAPNIEFHYLKFPMGGGIPVIPVF